MENNQEKIDVRSVLLSMSEDVANLSREKALMNAQLVKFQQLTVQLNQELEKVESELKELKSGDKANKKKNDETKRD